MDLSTLTSNPAISLTGLAVIALFKRRPGTALRDLSVWSQRRQLLKMYKKNPTPENAKLVRQLWERARD